MEDPQEYRDYAAKLRDGAMTCDDPDVYSIMVDAAELYDRLADILERKRRKAGLLT
jgi:hypothetical protein